MNKRSVMIKATATKEELIDLYLDLILIWNNNNHPDKTKTINDHVKTLRDLMT